ncbi:hypothetical protein Poly21_09440 [Allorhodopirellula heiligendammensis]|uniref:Uncharacterized protein n=2 Tax=Allorhodopirellula heiligendammensis TaxID=2714739 RepID=A0A5C6C3P2_9BACT|nr:hypothetical protein Poly21_09440 [Allorhodopirellula heiligendammensis]
MNSQRPARIARAPSRSARRVVNRVLSFLLTAAIGLVFLYNLFLLVLFGQWYFRFNGTSETSLRFPPPGEVSMDLPPIDPMPAMPAAARHQLQRATESTVWSNDWLARASNDFSLQDPTHVRAVIAGIQDGRLSLGERERRLLLLTEIDRQSDAEDLVKTLLAALADDRGQFSPESIRRVSQRWTDPSDEVLRAKIAEMCVQHERELQNLRNGSTSTVVQMDLPSNAALIEDAEVSGSQDAGDNHANIGGKNAAPSRADSIATAASHAIKELNFGSRSSSLKTFSTLPPGDLLLQEVRSRALQILSRASDSQSPELGMIPEWIDALTIVRGDRQLHVAIRNFVAQCDQPSADASEIYRVISLAASSGDPAWVTTLLEYLPVNLLSLADDEYLSAAERWPAAMTATIDHLCRGDTHALTSFLAQPTLAGAISSDVLRRRSHWSDETISDILELVLAQSRVRDANTLSWLKRTRIDDDTRRRVTVAWNTLPDEASKITSWLYLTPIMDAFSQPSLAERATHNAISRIGVDNLVNRLLDGRSPDIFKRENWTMLQDTIDEHLSSADPDRSTAENELAREIDEQLVRHLLRSARIDGKVLIEIVGRFGGPRSTVVLQANQFASQWTERGAAEHQIQAAIHAMQSRGEHDGL